MGHRIAQPLAMTMSRHPSDCDIGSKVNHSDFAGVRRPPRSVLRWIGQTLPPEGRPFQREQRASSENGGAQPILHSSFPFYMRVQSDLAWVLS
jgi:hypothetical protein